MRPHLPRGESRAERRKRKEERKQVREKKSEEVKVKKILTFTVLKGEKEGVSQLTYI